MVANKAALFIAGFVLGAGFMVWITSDYDMEDAAYNLGWKDAQAECEGRS